MLFAADDGEAVVDLGDDIRVGRDMCLAPRYRMSDRMLLLPLRGALPLLLLLLLLSSSFSCGHLLAIITAFVCCLSSLLVEEDLQRLYSCLFLLIGFLLMNYVIFSF